MYWPYTIENPFQEKYISQVWTPYRHSCIQYKASNFGVAKRLEKPHLIKDLVSSQITLTGVKVYVNT